MKYLLICLLKWIPMNWLLIDLLINWIEYWWINYLLIYNKNDYQVKYGFTDYQFDYQIEYWLIN